MSAVLRCVAVERPRVRCMMTVKATTGGWMAGRRSLKDTTTEKRRYMVAPNGRTSKLRNENEEVEEVEVDSGEALLKMYSLSQWQSFPEVFTK